MNKKSNPITGKVQIMANPNKQNIAPIARTVLGKYEIDFSRMVVDAFIATK